MNFNQETPCPRILFCSLSSKFALYKEVLRGAQLFSQKATVVGCDCDVNCEAASLVDEFIKFPHLSELTGEKLLEILTVHKITHVLPTRDAELPFWASHKNMLSQNGINVWVSNSSFVQNCNDKLAFSENWKDANVSAIQSFTKPCASTADLWVAKARYGSGAKNLHLGITYNEALELSNEYMGLLIFQPFVDGQEFTVEAWINRANESYGPLLRWRKKVVNGESHETTVFKNEEYENLLNSIFLHLPGGYGHCVAQVLVDSKGKLHLIEINPRLGGASPLALRAGINSITWHLMEDYGHSEAIPGFPSISYGMSLSKTGINVSITQ